MNGQPPGISPAFFRLSATALWGIATVLSKSLLSNIEPIPLLFVQLLASCLLLLPAIVMLKRRSTLSRALLPAALLGVVNPGIAYTFSMMALERIPASVASIFWTTEPFLILLLAALLVKERITLATTAVIAVGFAGAALVTGIFPQFTGISADPGGVGYMMIAVCLCAIYTVLSRKLTVEIDPLVLVAVQQLAGLAWATLLLAVVSSPWTALNAASAIEIMYAALTGILYYAIAYWLYLVALNRVSAALAGASFNVIPVVAIVVAYVFLGESLSSHQLAGVFLILLSGFMLVKLTSRAPF